MPELPEVQSTVDYLNPRLKGRTILACEVKWARSIVKDSPKQLQRLLLNSKVSSVTRRGKFIVIWLTSQNLASEAALLIHLRMSGCLEVVSRKINVDPYDRVILELDNNKDLRFNDVRKFGKIQFASDPHSLFARLGPEPLEPEFTSEKFLQMLKGKRGTIKPLLLNQAFIAGIGNIYADESLWRSGIHPQTIAGTLKAAKAAILHQSICQVLLDAIALKGTDNGDEVIEGGLYEPSVYGKHGQSCLRCGRTIVRIVVGQRGTHYCPACQKRARR